MTEKPTPQPGDVWESKKGSRTRVLVTGIDRHPWECDVVCWRGVTRQTSGRCALSTFARGRILVKRDGKEVPRES